MTDRTGKLSRLATLLALATAIHSLEALIPFTVGWFKFGFSNIVGLATLYIFGFKDVALLTIGRILLGGLIRLVWVSRFFARERRRDQFL